jgi:drug/metabolite transporter (DMT)-like permease
MPNRESGKLTVMNEAAVADIFALACAAAGWFYLFSSNAAKRLAGLESQGRNSLRIVLRRICGVSLFLLAVACYAGFNTVNDQRNPGAYLAVWTSSILLLMLIIILVAIDIHLTMKLKRERTHKP